MSLTKYTICIAIPSICFGFDLGIAFTKLGIYYGFVTTLVR